MNQVYSEFLGAAGDDDAVDELPFEDMPTYTGNEWWRDGAPRPPGNFEYANGIPLPNAPFGTSFAADGPIAYNPSKRAPYGANYDFGTEVAEQLMIAIDSDPYAIGQNLGLTGAGSDMSDWDDSVQDTW